MSVIKHRAPKDIFLETMRFMGSIDLVAPPEGGGTDAEVCAFAVDDNYLYIHSGSSWQRIRWDAMFNGWGMEEQDNGRTSSAQPIANLMQT